MAAFILYPSRESNSIDEDAAREFVITSELAELLRLGLITPVVFSRCCRYLEKHPEEFAPQVVGAASSSDVVDMLLQVAS